LASEIALPWRRSAALSSMSCRAARRKHSMAAWWAETMRAASIASMGSRGQSAITASSGLALGIQVVSGGVGVDRKRGDRGAKHVGEGGGVELRDCLGHWALWLCGGRAM
jgi:hypothetical protein